jgi:flavodoxin
MKTLVTYYSRTGNTKFVADKIAEQLNAEICEVVDKKNRKGKLVFLTGGYAALREKLTKIEVTKTINDYDFIIVGSPVWAGKIAPAIRTFLVLNDFSDKQVAFFVTLGGDKPEKALNNMKKAIAPNIPVEELGIINAIKNPEEIEKQIADWCKKIIKH